MMGCTLMGVTLIGMMASFPHVRTRVKHWDRSLQTRRLLPMPCCRLRVQNSLGNAEKTYAHPRRYNRVLRQGCKTHPKKRGFYLTSALRDRGIGGLIPGATRVWKFNTYSMTEKQARYTADAFTGIARENGLRE